MFTVVSKNGFRDVRNTNTPFFVLLHKDVRLSTNDLPSILPSVLELLQLFEDVFLDDIPVGLPLIRGIEHQIDLVPGASLLNSPTYRTNLEETKEIQYRQPIPRLDDMLDELSGSNIFFDDFSGYHQISLNIGDEWKTYLRQNLDYMNGLLCLFGLTNAPSTFMGLMNYVLRDFIDKFVVVYFDDIFIYSKSIDEHIDYLRHVLAILQTEKLYGNIAKCMFCTDCVVSLGFVVTALDFRAIAAPLKKLTKKDIPFKWGDEQKQTFNKLKHKLCEAPLLQLSNFDKTCEIECDASGIGISGVLIQK
ncbi:hypothetical protein U9M48_042456, partial [Paspalum notatum var. saurae]